MYTNICCNSKKVDNEHDKKISKKLSYILRHGAVKKGLSIRSDGFINLQEVLREIPGCTIDDVKRIVATNDKQRFALDSFNNVLMIRANQGHTIARVDSLDVKLLTGISFDIIHGTHFHFYERIKSEGLSRMKRNHVHFAKGLNFVCGLRKSAEIFIYIDFSKAKNDGLEFYESENGVVLSSGNSKGYIEPKYFLKVVDRSGQIL